MDFGITQVVEASQSLKDELTGKNYFWLITGNAQWFICENHLFQNEMLLLQNSTHKESFDNDRVI